ncbi:PA2779 family protein [Hydrocarboniphaga sp.]|uniref:PA2779 family protein n=1 Tax=Hydrocarboniphaga sp. TaxID=2033016 RepID=UPI003D0EEEF2
MGNRTKLGSLVSGVVVTAMLAVSSWVPANAAMITTEQMVATDAGQMREARVAQVQGFLARADVKDQLVKWGVASEMADARVAQLSDAELEQLSMKIDQQPAGGDFLIVLGVVFLILIVLELVGVTHVFSSF